jgi:EAL domain-containing protein (putative c-di-GMP-specific phosphodiesterase class I)
MLKTLEVLLKQIGVNTIHTSDNAHDALKLIANQNKHIDIIISDLNMPEMDGIQLLRHLGGLGVSKGIILVSGEDPRLLQSVKTLGETFDLMVLGTLGKPVSKSELGSLIESYEPSDDTPPTGPAAMVFADELRSAITQKELTVHYQPQISLVDGRVVAVEALARWRHPQKGMISPSIFIGIAEKYGMIDDLTTHIFNESITQAAQWRAQGFEIDLSVNFSAQALTQLDMPEVLYEPVQRSGMRPQNLTIESTESTLADDLSIALDILTRMRLKGFGLSIDDFGTGFSSLDQLQKIPFTELKVDRSFVHNAHANKACQAILESSIALTKRLGIASVAEGVEDESDLELVKAHGCDIVQGYYFARPMPAEEFIPWAREYSAKRAQG